jgi:phosphoglycolate phosphatase
MGNVILFDLDGTLVDTPRAIAALLGDVLQSLGRKVPPEAIRSRVGRPLELTFAELLDSSPQGHEVLRAAGEYRARFAEAVLPKAPDLLFAGVGVGLVGLRRRGKVMAVATSKITRSAEALLEAAQIRHQFDAVIGVDQVSCPKPDPETIVLALKTVGAAAAAVMVGDTVLDVEMAHRAGIPSIAVSYGVDPAPKLRQANPTYLAHSFGEVVRLCLS